MAHTDNMTFMNLTHVLNHVLFMVLSALSPC